MSGSQVLLIAGTHGNEINAPWLLDQWKNYPGLINNNDLTVLKIIGNPEALKEGKRYINCDLNRCFRKELLNDNSNKDYEVVRAREIIKTFGPKGSNPSQITIDLHSTTSSMGSSIVVYGRRFPDLAFASLVQSRLGLPIYLHEGDNTQQGFLVESWPCGLVIEIGPVPQGVLHPKIIDQSRLAIEICFEELAKLNKGLACFPEKIVIHRHIRSIDFPRAENKRILGVVHPERQGADWKPLSKGSPLFMKLDGNIETFEENEPLVPVFINEAAYAEKNIAMSLTKREVWNVLDDWKYELLNLICLGTN
ncbi:aspartoacylase [Prochlorococcus sp. MIT 1307]|uniref:aspartoacylase n=1 Tax=Prochlorococcus sp. MIT 1307 TaxID=3096219 RepID=UPI002A75D3DF|nr:aspartoacylase [Prochlorococcus sp. MIT 1307]